MKKILTTSYCFSPAEHLRDGIEARTGKHFYILTEANRIRSKDEVLFRYGNSQACIGIDTKYNSREFINFCANKFSFSILMQQNKIASPVYYEISTPENFPVMIRESLNSTGGKGIHVVENEAEFNSVMKPGWFWTPFISLSSEYRIHVLGGKIVKILKKIEGENTPEEKYPIRNYCRGWKFSIRTNLEAFPKFQDLVNRLNAIQVFQDGGKFYGLDVGIIKGTKEVFVLENNSAVGLSDPDVEMYLDYLIPELNL